MNWDSPCLDPDYGFVYVRASEEGRHASRASMALHRAVAGMTLDNQSMVFDCFEEAKQANAQLGLPPVLTYATSVLLNCNLPQAQALPEPEDIVIQETASGTMDEAWFYSVSAAIEACSGPLLRGVREGGRVDAQLIWRMGDLLKRMPERCHPHIFHQQVRPLLSGWEPPEGLLLKEVRYFYHGASAAQSPLFMALDHLLGIKHPPKAQAYLADLRANYLLPTHCQFLNQLIANQPPIPNPEAIAALRRFRSLHWAMVDLYIWHQDPAAKGTGGTDPSDFLSAMRQ